ncbi:MAG: hypothetical protein ACREFP_13200 [Acetobacteraceae bacterium]
MARIASQLEWIWLYEQADATWLLRIEPPTTAPNKANATKRPLIITFSRYSNGWVDYHDEPVHPKKKPPPYNVDADHLHSAPMI